MRCAKQISKNRYHKDLLVYHRVSDTLKYCVISNMSALLGTIKKLRYPFHICKIAKVHEFSMYK